MEDGMGLVKADNVVFSPFNPDEKEKMVEQKGFSGFSGNVCLF